MCLKSKRDKIKHLLGWTMQPQALLIVEENLGSVRICKKTESTFSLLVLAVNIWGRG